MRYKKATKKPRIGYKNDDWQLEKMIIRVPFSFLANLKDWSRYSAMPMSRLIAIAIDKEMHSENPFHYPTELPDSEYEEYEYILEAEKVLNYICKFPRGIGKDLLLICRYDFDIESREDVLHGVRELLEKGMIMEIIPNRDNFKLWKKDYRVLRAVDAVIKDRKPKKFKQVEEGSTRRMRRITDKEVEG